MYKFYLYAWICLLMLCLSQGSISRWRRQATDTNTTNVECPNVECMNDGVLRVDACNCTCVDYTKWMGTKCNEKTEEAMKSVDIFIQNDLDVWVEKWSTSILPTLSLAINTYCQNSENIQECCNITDIDNNNVSLSGANFILDSQIYQAFGFPRQSGNSSYTESRIFAERSAENELCQLAAGGATRKRRQSTDDIQLSQLFLFNALEDQRSTIVQSLQADEIIIVKISKAEYYMEKQDGGLSKWVFYLLMGCVGVTVIFLVPLALCCMCRKMPDRYLTEEEQQEEAEMRKRWEREHQLMQQQQRQQGAEGGVDNRGFSPDGNNANSNGMQMKQMS